MSEPTGIELGKCGMNGVGYPGLTCQLAVKDSLISLSLNLGRDAASDISVAQGALRKDPMPNQLYSHCNCDHNVLVVTTKFSTPPHKSTIIAASMSDTQAQKASAEAKLAKLKTTLTMLKDFSRAFLEQIANVEADIEKAEREVARVAKSKQSEESQEGEDEEGFHLSPSLVPDKCATAPEIALWSRSDDLLDEYQKIARAIRTKVYDDDAIRKMANMRRAYAQTYELRSNELYDFPPGALGTKLRPQKYPRGCIGLRTNKDRDVPKDEDVYTPIGETRKLENRPQDGRWYYPQPSSLRNEYHAE
ncbi:hypothetical protein IWX50DRAFT_679251 [Phyllosticta citricarpa]|uniref:Uncharacterized protein n=2 Tax=Phyllosticta TaxID=121621 RepID=A0ABR1M8A6_9PEZI